MYNPERLLIVVSHKLHEIHPSSGSMHVKGGFPLIINELARYFEQVILAVPVQFNELVDKPNPYSENIRIISLERGERIFGKIKKNYQIARIIRENPGLIYAMGPNLTGLTGMFWSKIFKRNFFVSVDTDKAEVTMYSSKNRLLGFLHSNFTKFFHYNLIKLLAAKHPLFVTGDMFLGKKDHWYQWVKSTHKEHEIKPYSEPVDKPNKKFTIIFAGRLSPEKNIETLIKAFQRIDSSKFSLIIVGEGPALGYLQDLASSLGLSNVFFKGYVANDHLKNTNFLHADLLVLPSISERQGKVLLEAMSCSLPVIASNTSGISSIISHRINGMLFNPKDDLELSRNILELTDDLPLRKKIAEAGYEFSKKHALDIEVGKIVTIVRKFYEQE